MKRVQPLTRAIALCAVTLLLAVASSSAQAFVGGKPLAEGEGEGGPSPERDSADQMDSPDQMYLDSGSADAMDSMEEAAEEEEEGGNFDGENPPMGNPADGTSCSIEDEDREGAVLAKDACDSNTFMCCWDDGEMDTNAEVCSGGTGSLYCHGFTWADDADMATNVLPLYHYVKNVDRTAAPECGCIEEMPAVSNAACSRYSADGIGPCGSSELRGQYKKIHGQDLGTNLQDCH